MSDLIILFGKNDYHVSNSSRMTYVYSIGSASVYGREVVNVNDSEKLREIALEVREEYSRWIYSLNKMFVRKKLTYQGLSLFLMSDCSCKRTELFDTYASICNLLLIREIIAEREPKEILLIHGDSWFLRGLESVAGGIPIIVENLEKKKRNWFRRVASDLRFVMEIALVVSLTPVIIRRSDVKEEETRRYFFSIFPKMTESDGRDKKYGDLVNDNDRYAVNILTDGFHQHISVLSYFRILKNAKRSGLKVIDDYFTHSDWITGLYWLFRIKRSMLRESASHYFRGIDVSSWIREELSQSASRLARFMAIKGAYQRFFQDHCISEFVYYLHEYPLGRLISWLLRTRQPHVTTYGFQHGPAAQRKLLYYMSANEAKEQEDFLTNVPIPQEVLAEDNASAEIYQNSGYRNVRVMDKIYRLDYLENILPRKDAKLALIAPGLHDGEEMLETMSGIIYSNQETRFFLKPHPLANNTYANKYQKSPNLVITGDSIQDLLSQVSVVYVTYSSVGLEALKMEIAVRVVEIPGVINQSPLGDLKNYESMVIRSN